MDYVYDPVPGEAPFTPMPDYELGVPHSFFEYEIDNKLHYLMTVDQQFIPEDERPWGVEKNPNCSKEYWKPQVDLQEEQEMNSSDWMPNTEKNVYGDKDFVAPKKIVS